MTTTKEPSHTRVFSLLSLGSDSSTSRSNEDPNRPSSTGLRPLPSSRDASPNPLLRSTPDIRSSRSPQRESPTQHVGAASSHHRLPSLSLRSTTSMQNLSSARSDASVAGHQFHNIGPSPSSSQQYGLPLRQSPIGTPSYSPHSAASVGLPGDDVLLPPPKIRDQFPDRSSSSNSNRVGNKLRSRSASRGTSSPVSRTSSPAPILDLPRPSTPGEGRLTKKKSWLPGRSHNRSEGGSGIASALQAWVVSPQGNIAYDASNLMKAQPVSDRRSSDFVM